MKGNSNQNSMEINDIQGSNFKFLIRLRGKEFSQHETPLKTDQSTRQSIQKTKSKSPDSLFSPSTKTKPKKTSKLTSPIHRSLTQSAKYSIFTSNPPSNTLVVTSKPIEGKLIDLTYKTPNDLYEFSQSILKGSSLLEYDKVFNESSSISSIYSEYFKERVNDLFQGRDSAAFFFGPKEGGKSYALRGGATDSELGVLNKIIEAVFNLIDVSKQSYVNDRSNELLKSFVVKMQIYQVYQERVSDLIGIEGRILEEKEIRNKKEYDDLLRFAIENRKVLAQKLKVNELKRKSSLIIKIILEKRSRENNRVNVFKYAQMTLVELPSSNYALMISKEEKKKNENDPSPNGVFYRKTKDMMINLRDALTQTSNGLTPSIECKLLETMLEIFNKSNHFIFFTCVDPFESSLKHSMKALKYANRLRHLVLNSKENAEGGNHNNLNENVAEVQYDNSDEEYNEIVQKQRANNPSNERRLINTNASIPFNQENQRHSLNSSPLNKEQKNSSPVMNKRNNSTIVSQGNIQNSYTQERSPCQSQKDFLLQKYQYLINQNPQQNRSNNSDSPRGPNKTGTIPKEERFYQNESINNSNIRRSNQYANRSISHDNSITPLTPIEVPHTSNEINNSQLQYDNSTLISDNIILKEDILRLSSINHRLTEELEMEHRHRADLDNRIHQLQHEKEMISNDLNQFITKQNDLIEEEESEDIYTKMNNRLVQERKIRKLMADNTALKQSLDKFETENKILTQHLNELKISYNKVNDELKLEQTSHNREVEQIEQKIESTTNELYNLQSENTYLRTSEEKSRQELTNLVRERDKYKEKYLKHKERNALLENQLKTNESQMQHYTIESKLKQNMIEENQKLKCDTKAKIVSDLKSKIDNFRSLTYKNRSTDTIE